MYMFPNSTGGTTPAPTAGRRAAGNSTTGPIDPLASPTKPEEEIEEEPFGGVPQADDDDDGPDWLDEDTTGSATVDPQTTNTATSDVPVMRQETLAPAAVAEPQRQPAATQQLQPQALASPMAASPAVSPTYGQQQATSEPRGNSPTMSAAPSEAVSAFTVPAPVAPAPAVESTIVKSPTTSTIPSQPNTQPQVAAPPPTQQIGGDPAEAAALAKELAELEVAVSASSARCDAMAASSSSSSTPVADVQERAIASLDDELTRAKAAKESAERERERRVKEIKDDQAAQIQRIERTEGERSAANLDSDAELLRRELKSQQAIVDALQREHDEMEEKLGAADSFVGDAQTQFGEALRTFLVAVRKNFNVSVKHVVAREVRDVAKELAGDRLKDREAGREERSESLRFHTEARRRAFDDFRTSHSTSRRTKVDSLFGDLKVKRQDLVENLLARGGEAASKKEKQLDMDVQQSRIQARQSIERVVARDQEGLRELEKSLEARFAESKRRLQAEFDHETHIFKTERDAIRRAMAHEDELGQQKHEIPSMLGDTVQNVVGLHERLKRLSNDVVLATKAQSVAQRLPSETQRLITEKEATVQQLTSQIESQKELVSRDRLRMESLLATFESHVDRFGKDLSSGRAQLNAGQQKIDLIRQSWEQSMRSSYTEGSTSHVHPDDAVVGVLFDACVKLRGVTEKSRGLATARRTNLRSLDLHSEDLAGKQDTVAALTLKMLSQFDELARVTAQLETRETQLRQEEQSLRHAKDVINLDREEFRVAAENIRHLSRKLQAESDALAAEYKENLAMGASMVTNSINDARSGRRRQQSKYQHLYRTQQPVVPVVPQLQALSHIGATSDLLTLTRVSDSELGYGNSPPVVGNETDNSSGHGRVGGADSLTTPSPDTDENRR